MLCWKGKKPTFFYCTVAPSYLSGLTGNHKHTLVTTTAQWTVQYFAPEGFDFGVWTRLHHSICPAGGLVQSGVLEMNSGEMLAHK